MTATSSELMSGLTPQGDPGLLRIALDNLLGNAWKYTGRQPETRIEFGATMEKAAWFTSSATTGAGFEMKYTGELFNAFQRLHTSDEFLHRHRAHDSNLRADPRVMKYAT